MSPIYQLSSSLSKTGGILTAQIFIEKCHKIFQDARCDNGGSIIKDFIKERNAASAFAISLVFCSSPSQHTLFWCINFETSDQRLNFESASGPEIKDNKDSSTLMVTASTSLKILTTVPFSPSLLKEEVLSLFSICFKFFKALHIAFFTAFLEVKYFGTSLTSPSMPRLLRKID